MLASIRLPRDPNRYARFAILFNQLVDAAGGTLTPKWLSDHENHCMKSNGTSLTGTVKAYLDLWGVSPKVQPLSLSSLMVSLDVVQAISEQHFIQVMEDITTAFKNDGDLNAFLQSSWCTMES